MLESLKAGLRAVRDDKALRGLIGLSFVGSFCAMPLVTFLPVFAQKVFHRDAKGYSALLAAFGIGAVLGAIAVAGVGHVRRKGILAVAMQMIFGGLMLAFALSRTIVLSYAILFFAGAALMVVFAMFMTLVQSNVEDRLRGRVVSVYSLAFRGAMPLGKPRRRLSRGAPDGAPRPDARRAGAGIGGVRRAVATLSARASRRSEGSRQSTADSRQV
jgi:predicted MFS family arabinose efflux permease